MARAFLVSVRRPERSEHGLRGVGDVVAGLVGAPVRPKRSCIYLSRLVSFL